MNCISGEYHSSPFKLESLTRTWHDWCQVKFRPLRAYRISNASLNVVYDPNASVRIISIIHLGMETVGSDVALWQVPARPTDQQVLTYT